MARVEGEIVISRPVDVMLDYIVGQGKDPQYNSLMLRAEKVSGGPVGKGARFSSAIMSTGRSADMLIEVIAYDQPVQLAQVLAPVIARLAEHETTLKGAADSNGRPGHGNGIEAAGGNGCIS